MAGLITELKNLYKNGGALIKLIFINSAVFLLFQIVYIFFFFTGNKDSFSCDFWFSMPSGIPGLLYRPWTLITYMFYHKDILHILFNMLNLYWFGKIFTMYFDDKKLVSLYLLGGLAGGLLYFIVYNMVPATFPGASMLFGPAILMGASGSIVAIMFAAAIYVPNFKVFMVFFGPVKLIYIAVFSLVIYVLLLTSNNTGGNLAHIGGALMGYIWAKQYMRGNEITKWVSTFLDRLLALVNRRKLKVTHKRPVDDMDYNKKKNLNQKEIDRILDKISKGGYGSLSKDEKDTLFRMSNKNN